MSAEIIPLRHRTYVAKRFDFETRAVHIEMSGTLDGFIDFAVHGAKTYLLRLDECRLLVAKLNSAVEDVQANCLHERDALLDRHSDIAAAPPTTKGEG